MGVEVQCRDPVRTVEPLPSTPSLALTRWYSGNRTQVLVRAVPAIDGVPLTNADNLREFVTQLEATNGSAATKPRSIVRLLQSKACRGTAVYSAFSFPPSHANQTVTSNRRGVNRQERSCLAIACRGKTAKPSSTAYLPALFPSNVRMVDYPLTPPSIEPPVNPHP